MDWATVVARIEGTRAEGAFLATTSPDGRPHVAWVGIGYGDETLWMATFRGSPKARNLETDPRFALHWQEHAEHLVFARGHARLVVDPTEVDELWKRAVIPYDLHAFWSGPADPLLQFVELAPDHISVRGTDHTAAPELWRRKSPAAASRRVGTAVMPNLFAADAAAAAQFYEDLLGLRPVQRFPQTGDPVHVVLRGGATQLAVTAGGPADVGLRPDMEHPVELIVWCDDVDAATAAAAAAGAEVLVAPYDHVGGHRRSYLADPAGNWVALVDA